jgi:hypothetical protein
MRDTFARETASGKFQQRFRAHSHTQTERNVFRLRLAPQGPYISG